MTLAQVIRAAGENHPFKRASQRRNKYYFKDRILEGAAWNASLSLADIEATDWELVTT